MSKNKYPKLPAGFGCIKKLAGKRRKPYAVYPSYKGLDENGCPIMPPALCYVDDWYKGFSVLAAYNAGTYTSGMENSLESPASRIDARNMTEAVQRILSDYSIITQRITGKEAIPKEPTFAEVYASFYKWKFGGAKEYSLSLKQGFQAAYKNCSVLHNIPFRSLRHADLQKVIDDCPLKHGSLELIKNLYRQMYTYADLYELCDKDYSLHVSIDKPEDDEHGVPFTEADLNRFWRDRENSTAQVLLILCYSGHRISELQVVDVNLDNMSFTGGIKNVTSKNRTVPIHSAIQSIVKTRMERYGCLLPIKSAAFRYQMRKYLSAAGIDTPHTPHDCRHTFSALCEKYQVAENDRKRLLGHSFASADITNRVYGHRTLDDLRAEIEKIPAPSEFCY